MANNNAVNDELDFEKNTNQPDGGDGAILRSNKIKDPDDWATGDEPMTGAQRSYVQTLSKGEADENMTKAEASKFIEEHKQDASSGQDGAGNTIKDPADWSTGDEKMTDAQRSYLKTLSDEAGESTDENLSKAAASKRIDELQHTTGRGLNK